MATWFFHPGATIVGWIVWALGGARVIGLEHVPREGAFILVSNHCSNLDPPMLGWALGHRIGRIIHFMAKVEIRRWPLIGWLASQAGVFFVRRGESDRGAQRQALAYLRADEPIGVFPEGTRSRDGRLRRDRSRGGAALLAIRTGAPLLPVGIAGTHRYFPGRSRFPHRSRATVRVGQPFHLATSPSGPIDREALTVGTERIMAEIAALLPPEQGGTSG